LEITILFVPKKMIVIGELREIAKLIVDDLGRDVPWDISDSLQIINRRAYRRTSLESLERAYRIGREAGLYYIYIGNINSKIRQSVQSVARI